MNVQSRKSSHQKVFKLILSYSCFYEEYEITNVWIFWKFKPNTLLLWLIIRSSLPNTRYGHPALLPSGSMTFNNDLVFQFYTVYTLARYTEIPTLTLLLNLIIISLCLSCIFKVTLDVLDDVSEGFNCLRKRWFSSQRNFNTLFIKHSLYSVMTERLQS